MQACLPSYLLTLSWFPSGMHGSVEELENWGGVSEKVPEASGG